MARSHRSPPPKNRTHPGAHALAQGLGWFSIGLGLAEVAFGRRLTRSLGLEEHANLIRFYGLREIATGIGILASRDPTPWIWGRVAGDAADLATLTTGLSRRNPERDRVGLAVGAVAVVTAFDVICAQGLQGPPEREPKPLPDYSNRSGYPRGLDAARGAAADFEVPHDFRVPEPLRPYGT